MGWSHSMSGISWKARRVAEGVALNQFMPEGVFLATELPGLVAQGLTVAEALDIARDVARKLIEARREREGHNL
jgi:hypothetical protein